MSNQTSTRHARVTWQCNGSSCRSCSPWSSCPRSLRWNSYNTIWWHSGTFIPLVVCDDDDASLFLCSRFRSSLSMNDFFVRVFFAIVSSLFVVSFIYFFFLLLHFNNINDYDDDRRFPRSSIICLFGIIRDRHQAMFVTISLSPCVVVSRQWHTNKHTHIYWFA